MLHILDVILALFIFLAVGLTGFAARAGRAGTAWKYGKGLSCKQGVRMRKYIEYLI